MFFLSQNCMELVESHRVFIGENDGVFSISAVSADGAVISLASYGSLEEAQKKLRAVYAAAEDEDSVFTFE